MLDSNLVEDIVALHPMQQSMLFRYLNAYEDRHYYEQNRYRLTGIIDVELLKKSIWAVCQQNEMLRTVFRWKGLRHPVQVVLRNQAVPIWEYDLTPYPEQEKNRICEEMDHSEYRKHIDLEETPLLFILLKKSINECEVIIRNHHIIFDGWSNGIFLKEIIETYSRAIEEQERRGGLTKTKYKSYMKWLQSKTVDKEFWSFYLRGFTQKTMLPYAKTNNPGAEQYLEYSFSNTIKEQLVGYCGRHEVTPAAVFYLAWAIVLHKNSLSGDIVFGITLSGRNAPLPGIEHMIGLFINTVPLRIHLEPEQRVDHLVNHVNHTLLELNEHCFTPPSDIAAAAQLPGQEALFDSVVVVQNYPMDKQLLRGGNPLNIKLVSRSYKTGLPLSLGIRIFDGIEMDMNYNMEMYSKDEANTILAQYVRAVDQILRAGLHTNPSMVVSDIEVRSTEEIELLVRAIQVQKNVLKHIEEVDFDEII